MHYIGMDCHITTLDFAVVNEAGQLVKANSVATSVIKEREARKRAIKHTTTERLKIVLLSWVT